MDLLLGYSAAMMFWILAALLTAAVTLALLAPAMRARKAAASADDYDVEVYRDQLGEVDRDLEAGALSPAEAELARAEIARRLMRAAGKSGETADGATSRKPSRFLPVAISLFIPLLAIAGYLVLGSPNLPSQPLAARSSAPGVGSQMADLVSQAERHLAENPDDGRGWEVLAPIYLRAGRIDDAVTAYRNAIRVLGSTAQREANLGEALVAKSVGIVTEDARAAFARALQLEPDDPKSAFYMALAMAQEGRVEDAIAAFRVIEERGPADAPWIPLVRQQIEALGGEPAEGEPGVAGVGNPSAADVEAAQSMSAGDRMDMIRGMVSQLDEKLRDDPANIEGWQRLVQSYVVLDEPDAARDALQRGLAAFPADTEDGRSLLALADQLGLTVEKRTE